ncbi:Beta-L-arabinobiosidase [Orchesella cincta]|uniref:Beta-L-arabinobiosidase n=1 Tax=Orchesella cincta TaxID=48709 RepID=A0A1D2M891_ORCCI|nr:Beta-L-arabinobiosidase [Orchesella cincta]
MAQNIPPPIVDETYARKKIENYAANANGFGYPMVDSSFTSAWASVWQVVDGRVFYDYIPSNRWSNFGSQNEVDWLSVDFGPGRVKTVDQVKLYVYSDVVTEEGEVDCPTNVTVEILSSTGNWTLAQNQVSTPSVCIPNDVLTIHFDPVQPKSQGGLARNQEENWFVGITELEIWAPGHKFQKKESMKLKDGFLTNAKIGASETAKCSYVGEIDAEDASVEVAGIWVDESKEYEVRFLFQRNGRASYDERNNK